MLITTNRSKIMFEAEYKQITLLVLIVCSRLAYFVILCVFVLRYGVELIYKKQPLIRARGVSYCKNLLSPRFEHSEGKIAQFFFMRFHLDYFCLNIFLFSKSWSFSLIPDIPLSVKLT